MILLRHGALRWHNTIVGAFAIITCLACPMVNDGNHPKPPVGKESCKRLCDADFTTQATPDDMQDYIARMAWTSIDAQDRDITLGASGALLPASAKI